MPVLEKAAAHKDPRVRVAAAHSAQNLPIEGASSVLTSLVADADVGVQKVALRSVPSRATTELRISVERVSKAKANPAIKELSTEVLSEFR